MVEEMMNNGFKTIEKLAKTKGEAQFLVEELFWEYDNLSSSGKKLLNQLANILEIKEDKSDEELLAMGLPPMYLTTFKTDK